MHARSVSVRIVSYPHGLFQALPATFRFHQNTSPASEQRFGHIRMIIQRKEMRNGHVVIRSAFICILFFPRLSPSTCRFCQPQFLCTAQVLQMPLTAQRFMLFQILLGVNQLYRSAAPGVFCSLAAVVGTNSLFQVCRPAAVKCVVSTADKVYIVHAQSMWMTFSIRSVAFTFGLW